MDKPKALTELLHLTDFPAEGILQRGQFLHRLGRLLATLLNDNFNLHCKVGNVRDGILIIYCDSTAWAVRLRYQAPSLLKELQRRNGLSALQQIEVRILPAQQNEKTYQRATLSSDAHHCLQACADSVNDDGLRAALLRLATHHKEQV